MDEKDRLAILTGTRSFFLAFLVFVLVRGLADMERFDFSLPLWAILLVSLFGGAGPRHDRSGLRACVSVVGAAGRVNHRSRGA